MQTFAFLERGKHCHHTGHIFRPRSASLFLLASKNKRRQPPLAWALQKAHTFWTAKLVGAATHPIAIAQALGRQFPNPLRRVTKKRHLALATQSQHLLPRL